jgi:ABC-2 type transport system permease protein
MSTTTSRTSRDDVSSGERSGAQAARVLRRPEGVTLPRVITSESIKLRSLRSSRYALAAIALLVVLLGVFMAVGEVVAEPESNGETVDALGGSLSGVGIAELIAAALGVLVVSGEYASGMIRPTFTAVPRRWLVVVAKALVVAVTVFAAALAATLLAFTIAQQLLTSDGKSISFSAPGVLRALVGAALYLALIAVLGAGFGWLLRSTAGALMTLFAILYLLPVLEVVLPRRVSDTVMPYLPANAGSALMQLTPGDLLAPWTGFAVLLGYSALVLGAAAVVVQRRDA